MYNRFDEKYAVLLKTIDAEIADFYSDWLHLRGSEEFEASVNLSVHLAREILEGLREVGLKKKNVSKDIAKIWKSTIKHLEKFRHNRNVVWETPRRKEEFDAVWPEFEKLLIHILESNFDLQNPSDHVPFTILHDSLVLVKDELSQSKTNERHIYPNFGLSVQQSEINRNLETLSPLLAAFYRDWLRIQRSTNLKCSTYLLGHLAREIAGGFRDILAMKQDESGIKADLKNEDLGDLKGHKGHIASIMSALGAPDFDSRAEQWIEMAKNLATLAHKNRDDKARVLRKESESLWPKFEELLAYLVGGYLNLLNRVDKIGGTEMPNEDMIKILPNLLNLEVLYGHFFLKLKSPAWLKPLKKEGWFDLQSRPPFYEVPDQPGTCIPSVWYPLVYVEKVANHTEKTRVMRLLKS